MPAPPNDLCVNAITVGALPYSDTQDITSATQSVDDPNNLGNFGNNPPFQNVWYKWTAPANMDMMADTLGTQPFSWIVQPVTSQGTSITAIGVFTGSCGGVWTQIAGSTNGIQSRVRFSAVSGTTYYFNVGRATAGSGGNSATQNLVFRLFQTHAAPANDLCVNAIVVNAFPTTDGGRDVYAATVSVDDPNENIFWGGQVPQTVWYKVTSPFDTVVTVDATGSDPQPILAVWSTGACGSLGGEIDAQWENGGGSQTVLTWAATAGVPYYVEVGQFVGSPAPYPAGDVYIGNSLTLAFTSSGPPPAPDPPTGLVATAIDFHAGLQLSWSPAAGGTTPDIYIIESCVGAGCSGFVQIGTVPFGTNTYTDYPGGFNNVARYGQTYRYRVKAHSALAGDSTYAGPVQVTAVTPDPATTQYGGYLAVLTDCQRGAANLQTPLMKITGNDGLVFQLVADNSTVSAGGPPPASNIPMTCYFQYAGSGNSSPFIVTVANVNTDVPGPSVRFFGSPLQAFEVVFKQQSFNTQTEIPNIDGELQFYQSGVLLYSVTGLTNGAQPWNYVQVGPWGYMELITLSDRTARCSVYSNTYPNPAPIITTLLAPQVCTPVGDRCALTMNVIYNQNFLGASEADVFDFAGNYWTQSNPGGIDPFVNTPLLVRAGAVVTNAADFIFSDVGYLYHFYPSGGPTPLTPTPTPPPPVGTPIVGIRGKLRTGLMHVFGYHEKRPQTPNVLNLPLGLNPKSRVDTFVTETPTHQLTKVNVDGSQPFANPSVSDENGYFSEYVPPSPIDVQFQGSRYTLPDYLILDPRVLTLISRVYNLEIQLDPVVAAAIGQIQLTQAIGSALPLGGALTVGVIHNGVTDVISPVSVALTGSQLAGLSAVVIATVKTDDPGTSVTPVLYNTDTNSPVGTGVASVSTVGETQSFLVTVDQNTAHYHLRLIPSNANAAVYGTGYLFVSRTT